MYARSAARKISSGTSAGGTSADVGVVPVQDPVADVAGPAAVARRHGTDQGQPQPDGGAALADPRGTVEQVGVRHAPGRDRAQQEGDRMILSDDVAQPHGGTNASKGAAAWKLIRIGGAGGAAIDTSEARG